MRWSTLSAAVLICLPHALGTPGSHSTALHRRYDYDPFLPAGISRRQAGQRCGAENNGQICPGQSCCSMYGWCGDGPQYCNRFSCQVEFGWCEGQPIPTSAPEPEPTTEPEPEPEPTTVPADPTSEPGAGETSLPVPPEFLISQDGICGNVTTCVGSTFGRCCSEWYWCGSDETYCGDGCREEFGGCGEEPPQPEEPEEPPETGLVISTDGMCGNGTTCAGSSFGGCCSWYFWCGSDESYCGDGCRGGFGNCEEVPEEPQLPVLDISTNGMCGNGTTCTGSEYGSCCSWWFWCGSGEGFCTGDCRSEFGECGV